MFINFSATHQFEVEVIKHKNVEGLQGETLKLNWRFNQIPVNYDVLIANLHFNVTTPDRRAVICNWNSASQTPSVTSRGKTIFGTRILVSYKTNIYNFTLTNLQYNDAGPYFLEVAVGLGSIVGSQSHRSTIMVSKIEGTYEFIIFCCFFSPKPDDDPNSP